VYSGREANGYTTREVPMINTMSAVNNILENEGFGGLRSFYRYDAYRLDGQRTGMAMPLQKRRYRVSQVPRTKDTWESPSHPQPPSSSHSNTYIKRSHKHKEDTSFEQSIHRLVAKLPCASTIKSPRTPAMRSNVSIFCVKHLKSTPRSCNNRINACVNVGR